MYEDKKILFLGVGGSGMAPLSIWMKNYSKKVYGYDDYLRNDTYECLKKYNVIIIDLLIKEELINFDIIVYSNAIHNDNEFLRFARSKNIECEKRGYFLSKILAKKKVIAIVGSHGKTTTSGLVGHLINKKKYNFDYILGGFFKDFNSPGYACNADWIVVEIDESDGTIDNFSPEITVILNLDWDHPKYFKDFEEIKSMFKDLIKRTKKTIITTEEVISLFKKEDYKHLEDKIISLKKIGINNSFKNQTSLPYSKNIIDFNYINKKFALEVLKLSIVKDKIDISDFNDFEGISRRQNLLLDNSEFTIIEDYAHHPVEIESIINLINFQFDVNNLVVVFQPHRYSRTKEFKEELMHSLSKADKLFLLPVYAAFEDENIGGMREDLTRNYDSKDFHNIDFNYNGILELYENVKLLEKSHILFLGAGNINDFALIFCEFLNKKSKVEVWLEYINKKVMTNCLIKLNEDLSSKNTFKIGGEAKFYCEPSSLLDLKAIMESTHFFNLDYFCLGRGSNLLIRNIGYNGLIIRLNNERWRNIKKITSNLILVGGGIRLKELCIYVSKIGFSGYEFLEGIPGTLGGALRMNAGAMGKWIFDVVERVILLDSNARVHDIKRKNFTINYREIEEIKDKIVLGAILRLKEKNSTNAVRLKMDTYSDIRKGNQPIGASAGCIFKNPENSYAGLLIDKYGLKGYSIGGAKVSETHANFIINSNKSSSDDVINLINHIRRKVKEESGIILEPEVQLLGEDWNNILND